ncbi:Flp family type IVb pilin [Bradyrhizobium stylosanthis]|uniref:Flp pilus assembly pilin Flp n=1 Tax=Bradyrhizobium stylosanthis TaxID=1803665 RepID=A0A560DPV1_9BRAD|nr:Flp family type IVb pilin [Bradyrhizobium stylosanthis]TWA99147.1 Flp pilus assembly pilin Flp [Bradyrhizobium stylosanthis]
MRKFLEKIRVLRSDEGGAALVEYAVLLGIILAVTVGVFATIGSSAQTIFGSVNTLMSNAANP